MATDLTALSNLIADYKTTLQILEAEHGRLTRFQQLHIPNILKEQWCSLTDIDLIHKETPAVDMYEPAYDEVTIKLTLKDRIPLVFVRGMNRYVLYLDKAVIVMFDFSTNYNTVTELWNAAKNNSSNLECAMASFLYYLYFYSDKLPWNIPQILAKLKIRDE